MELGNRNIIAEYRNENIKMYLGSFQNQHFQLYNLLYLQHMCWHNIIGDSCWGPLSLLQCKPPIISQYQLLAS